MRYNLIPLIGLFCTLLYQSAYSQSNLDGLKVTDHINVTILITELNNQAQDIGLTKNRLQSRTEIRLMQVGLKPVTEQSYPVLQITVTVAGDAFSVRSEFKRPVFFYEDTNNINSQFRNAIGITYKGYITGMHGRSSEYVVDVLDEILDDFISKYLNAND